MSITGILSILLAAILTNNFVLSKFSAEYTKKSISSLLFVYFLREVSWLWSKYNSTASPLWAF